MLAPSPALSRAFANSWESEAIRSSSADDTQDRMARQARLVVWNASAASMWLAAGARLVPGGAVISEQIFNIPGVGRLLIQGVARRDYPLVQGVLLIIAAVYMCVNLLVDLTYALVDPRMRYSD